MDQIRIPWLVLALIVGLAALQTARVWWLRRRPATRARSRAKRAARGERDAETLLSGRGYRILERQAEGRWRVRVDGEEVAVDLRADFLVSRRGRRLVAEAKTGTKAPRITHGPTRRQLLEYRLAFAVDGVLLVDPERGTVEEVEFPLPSRPAHQLRWWLLTAALLGALVAAIAARQ